MAIVVPKIKTQYITLFNDEESYNAAKDDFTEVNWSAVKNAEHPDAVITPYQPSTRETHGFEPVDGETVKPDSAKRMFYYTFDHIFKTFFLEIIWGYSGWEWKDYEYNGTILKGGNLYKVKEITEVPSIPDGYRLQHINNFLNSQDKVTHVGTFDATNIISMLNAFSVGVKDQAFLLDTYNFPNVEAINGAFTGLPLTIADNHVLYLGKVIDAGTAFNSLKIAQYDTDIIKIEMPMLQTAASLLYQAYAYNGNRFSTLNLNDVFVGDTLNNVTNFNSFMQGFECSNSSNFTVLLDLTDTNIPSSELFNLSYFCSSSAVNVFDLKINNPVNLDYVLIDNINYKIKTLNLHGSEQLVRSIKHGFDGTNWSSSHVFPYTAPINETVNDNFEFNKCYFGQSITYDFSPNHTLKMTYGHFDKAKFNEVSTFSNVEYVNAFIFKPSSGFTNLPNTLWSANITYANLPGLSGTNPYTDLTRFKYISVGGSTVTIAPQTIYTCSSSPFNGNSLMLDNSIKLHVCQAGVSFRDQYENFYWGDERYRVDSFYISNSSTTALPLIYFHVLHTEGATNADFSSTGDIAISCNLIEDITIHIVDETDGTNLPYLNLNFTSGCTNIETVNVDADFRCNVGWNITSLSNLNMSNFETLLMHRQVGYYYNGGSTSKSGGFTCYQSQWDQLSSSCQAHCIDIFTKIDLVQEEE